MSELRNPLQNSLLESHKDLHQWFLLHQECLLLGYDEHACKTLDVFADYLHQHIDFENNALLPLFNLDSVVDEAEAIALRWQPGVYLKEHKKLLTILQKQQQQLRAYIKLQGRRKRLALLEVLDAESTFIHVMEHHEQREEQDLFVQMQILELDSIGLEWQKVDVELDEKYRDYKNQLKIVLED